MEIIIYNKEFEQQGIIETYTSLIWEEKYNEVGKFQLTASATVSNISLCKQGNYIYKTDGESAGVIEFIEIDDNMEDAKLTVNGRLTSSLLSNRIIIGTENISNVEQGLYNIVNNNAINVDNIRKIPNLNLGTLEKYLEISETQVTYKELTEALTSICQTSGLGYKMIFDTKNMKHVFKVYKGVDRSQGANYTGEFSDEFDNLISVKITKDNSEFKNVAIVLGEGEGLDRKMVIVNNASGLERRELYVDAKDIRTKYSIEVDTGKKDEKGNIIYENKEKTYTDNEYKNLLIARGKEKLEENLQVLTFDSEVEANSNMIYKKDYNLGDIVVCNSIKYSIKFVVRITEIKEVYEGDKHVFITFGNPKNNIIKTLKKGGN